MKFKMKTLLAVAGITSTLIMVSTVRAKAPEQVQPARHIAETDRLRDLNDELGSEPVDAYVDKVWRLVPGLSGWALRSRESEAETKRANDGKLHLTWELVPPKVSLADLPAQPIYRGPKTEKSIALMVNVSWGEEYIPAMLKTFRDAHVHATFFLDGQWVKAHPDLAKEIAREGHSIGSHGSGHPDFRKLSDAKLAEQIDGTNQTIEQACKKRVKVIAPPSGAFDRRLVRMTKERKMYTILWTADTVDWRKPPADVIVKRVKQGLTPGCLLLMHPTQPTCEALGRILKLIASSGYQTKTLDDVVNERPAVSPPTVLSDLR